MSMNCQSCRSQLPKEALACFNCGTLTSTHDAQAYDATAPSAQLQQTDISNAPSLSDPYNPSSPLSNLQQEVTNPYSSQSNPYRDPTTTSLPPPPPSRLSLPSLIPNRKKPVLISIS